jgi:hypothetical protein
MYVRREKIESFGSSPGANHEREFWLVSLDMKDTLSILVLGSILFCFGPPITKPPITKSLLGTYNANKFIILVHIFYINIF